MIKSVLTVVFAAALVACGGGGGGGSPGAAPGQTAIQESPATATVLRADTLQVGNLLGQHAVNADINGDGLEDLVIAGHADGASPTTPEIPVVILIQGADGGLTDKTSSLMLDNKIFGTARLLVEDYDGDGRRDILAVGAMEIMGVGSPQLDSFVFWNDGSRFSRQRIATSAYSPGVCSADVDADGIPEVFFGDDSANWITGTGLLKFNRSRQVEIVRSVGDWSNQTHHIAGPCSVIVRPGQFDLVRFGHDGSITNGIVETFDLDFRLLSSRAVTVSDVVNDNMTRLWSSVVDVNRDGRQDLVVSSEHSHQQPNSIGLLQSFTADAGGGYQLTATVQTTKLQYMQTIGNYVFGGEPMVSGNFNPVAFDFTHNLSRVFEAELTSVAKDVQWNSSNCNKIFYYRRANDNAIGMVVFSTVWNGQNTYTLSSITLKL